MHACLQVFSGQEIRVIQSVARPEMREEFLEVAGLTGPFPYVMGSNEMVGGAADDQIRRCTSPGM